MNETINGEPAAFLRFACGDFAVLRGVFAEGETITCPEVGCGVATTITGVQATEVVDVTITEVPDKVEARYVRAGKDSYMVTHLPDANWADEAYDVHSYGRRLGTVQRTGEEWSASPLPTGSGSYEPCATRTSALIRLGLLTQETQR